MIKKSYFWICLILFLILLNILNLHLNSENIPPINSWDYFQHVYRAESIEEKHIIDWNSDPSKFYVVDFVWSYPPGFSILLGEIHVLGGIDYPYITYVLIFVPYVMIALLAFLINRKIFNKTSALLSMLFITTTISTTNTIGYMYPHPSNIGILLIYTNLLCLLFVKKNNKNIFIQSILLGSVFLTHRPSTFVWFILLILFTMFAFINIKNTRKHLNYITVMFVTTIYGITIASPYYFVLLNRGLFSTEGLFYGFYNREVPISLNEQMVTTLFAIILFFSIFITRILWKKIKSQENIVKYNIINFDGKDSILYLFSFIIIPAVWAYVIMKIAGSVSIYDIKSIWSTISIKILMSNQPKYIIFKQILSMIFFSIFGAISYPYVLVKFIKKENIEHYPYHWAIVIIIPLLWFMQYLFNYGLLLSSRIYPYVAIAYFGMLSYVIYCMIRSLSKHRNNGYRKYKLKKILIIIIISILIPSFVISAYGNHVNSHQSIITSGNFENIVWLRNQMPYKDIKIVSHAVIVQEYNMFNLDSIIIYHPIYKTYNPFQLRNTMIMEQRQYFVISSNLRRDSGGWIIPENKIYDSGFFINIYKNEEVSDYMIYIYET